jgi:O-antigen/teichoic acid export membrane protein
MIPDLKSFRVNLQKNKILVENFTYLSVLQIANLVLFLITIPYLFKVLGTKNYGLVIFAQTVVYYFTVLVNFGFNLTATRDISVNRGNKEKVSEIVSSVIIIKLALFILSFALMVIMTGILPGFREFRILYLLSMIACLSEAIFPFWYFQGVEKMKYITFINISTRILSTALVFIFIKSESDYFRYPVILGLGTVSGAVIALYIIFFRHRISLRFIPVDTLRFYFSDNVLYFFSNVSTHIYVNANKLIAGSFLGMSAVAYYDVADKVINIVRVPYSVLTQVLFPRFAKDRDVSFLKKIAAATLLFTVIIAAGLILFSKYIIGFISSTGNIISADILKILSLSLIPISFSIFFGDIFMITSGLKIEYAKMRFFGLVLYLAIFSLLLLSGILTIYFIALMIVTVELFIAVYSYMIFRRTRFT